MAITRKFQKFLDLPAVLKIAIIQQIDDDRTLFRLFSTSRYMRSFLHANVNTIFYPRVQHLLTDLTAQPVTPLVLQKAEAYLRNKGKLPPYVVDQAENHTPFSYMVFKGFEKTAAAYLSNTNNRDEMRHKARHGYNLLSLAILSDNPAMVDFILAQPEASELIDEENDYTNKPIHIAARVGNRNILRSIISHPSFHVDFLNLPGKDSYSPLMIFCKYCRNDDVGFLQDLIGYGARVDVIPNPIPGFLNDPVFVAINRGKPRVAKVLLESIKHDVKRYLSSPRVILEEAVLRGYTDIVKVLVNECHVKCDKSIHPDKSLLFSALPTCDLELIRIVFQLESCLFKTVAVDRCFTVYGSLNHAVFADYLLGAMKSLTNSPASINKVEVNYLLVELGFSTEMIWHIGGENVFHIIANNLSSFIGETEESITSADRIISYLIQYDSGNNFRNKANDNGITPLLLLPKGEDQLPTTSFDERIKTIIAEARTKLASPLQAVEASKYIPRRLPVHDDADRRMKRSSL